MKRKYDVYGLGNAIVDLQLSVDDKQFEKLGLTKGSMNLVDSARQAELIKNFEHLKPHRASGGSVANSIISIAQLGGKAAFGGLIGDDDLGEFYAADMAKLGVHLYTSPVQADTTGTCVILITSDAERTMNTNLGASALFGAEHVSAQVTKESEWIFIEGYLFCSPAGFEAVRKAIRYATNNGTKIAITFSDAFIVNAFGEQLRSAVKYADLIFANLTEAGHYTAQSDENKIFAALQNVAPNVVMTMSERGARVSFDGTSFAVDAFKTAAVDDTGAGDMFAGSFLYAISNGLTAEDATRLACYLAGKVVSQLGPRLPEIPTGEPMVKELLAKAGL